MCCRKAVAVALAALALGCQGVPGGASPGLGRYENARLHGAYRGVDLLVVIDASNGMDQEQAILSTSLMALVGAMASPFQTENPETDWPYSGIDELRVAAVTSNMGVSSNGEMNDEYFPEELGPACAGFGDDGAFQGLGAANVSIQDGVIPCDPTAAQCPPGWACANVGPETGIGACHADGSTEIACLPFAAPWAETSPEAQNADFPIQAACLARQGSEGCGWSQPLASAARALERDDQEEFILDSHLLAILVVTDEEDCSMKDGEGLFARPEVADDYTKWNIACGENDEFLFEPGELFQHLTDRKDAGGVVFAAIVGVPYGSQDGADACQGPGDMIGDCLEQDEMQLDAEQPDGTNWYYHPACTRTVESVEVTKAYPGRRYVELAVNNFGNMSYIYSICNPDWSPAMLALARTAGELTTYECHWHQLEWNSAAKVAACDVVADFAGHGEACPEAFGGAAPIVEHETTDDGEELDHAFCALPKLPSERNCADRTPEQIEAVESGFGWYYCENGSAGSVCPYVFALTEPARNALAGLDLYVRCPE